MQSPPSSPVFPQMPPATAFPHLGTPMSPSLASPTMTSLASSNSSQPSSALCGWLYKGTTETTALSTADRPKLRWFIFNEESGELEYYRNPKDLNRLGAISIPDAAFLPDAVPGSDNLYSMDIVTSKKCYRIYHTQKATLDYWRQTLQKRRSAIQEALMGELPLASNNLNVGILADDVLVGSETIPQERFQQLEEPPSPGAMGRTAGGAGVDLGPHLEVEPRVHETNQFVGPHTESQMHAGLADVSVRNFSTEARNKLRSFASAIRHSVSQSNTANIPEPILLPTAVPDEHHTAALAAAGGTPGRQPQPQQRSPTSRVQTSPVSKTNGCDDCRKMRGENQDLRDHLKASNEQMESLKATLRLLVENKPEVLTKEEAAVSHQAKLESGRLAHAGTLDREVQERLVDLELERERLCNEVEIHEEVINDKDRQIVELRNQLEELQENPFGEERFRQEFNLMRNERDGYREQNQSLNAEVLNLRLLFSASVEHTRELIAAVKKLHEVYSQSSLRLKQRVEELSRPQMGSSVSALSERDRLEMLADALEEVGAGRPVVPRQLQTVLLEASGELTDEYGFYVARQELDSQQMIDLTTLGPDVNIAQYLEIPPMDSDAEASLTAKWERLMDECGLAGEETVRPLRKTPELKMLLRQGCPVRLRPRIWKALILFYVDAYRRENGGERIYLNLVEHQEKSAGFSIERKQIELDLHRSMPENKNFNVNRSSHTDSVEDIEHTKVANLKRVLLSFCEVSETVGYCQGLDRIAATLLLNVDEEISFWGLQVIVRRLRSENYYTSALRDAQVDQRVFKDLISTHVPNVSERLAQMDVDISLFSFNWFLTLFVDGFHWTIFMKIWDSFLYEGDKVIFRYAIAVVIYLEPILMHVNDVPSLYKVLRNAGRYIKDHRRLTEIAFCSLKSFPKRRITQKRNYFSAIVDKEIARVTEERQKRQQKSSTQAMFVDDSEDDEKNCEA